MLGIVDYYAGNSRSVASALDTIGVAHMNIKNAEDFERVERIILPGVGSALATIESLRSLGLVAPLQYSVIEEKKSFLGICIGLQILFEQSEEGDTTGFGWLTGNIRSFDSDVIRVPQIGWNSLTFQKDHPLFEGVAQNSHCYFVNSYHAFPKDPGVVIATTDYGGASTAAIAKDNIWATQFHIEKSGPVGLQMLANFARMTTKC